MYSIISLVFGVLVAALCIFCYVLGVRHGRIVANGGQPHMPNPVRAVREQIADIKAEKEAEEAQNEIDEILSASQETMIKALKKGREA